MLCLSGAQLAVDVNMDNEVVISFNDIHEFFVLGISQVVFFLKS